LRGKNIEPQNKKDGALLLNQTKVWSEAAMKKFEVKRGSHKSGDRVRDGLKSPTRWLNKRHPIYRP